jgi:hypothetical protein
MEEVMIKRFLLISAILAGFALCGYAQLPISVSAGLNGGLLFPQSSNLKGDFSDSHNYPLSKTSYSIGGKLRFSIAQLPISFVGLLSYNPLTDNFDLNVIGGPNGPVTTKYTYSLSVITAGIGAEYSFLPLPMFKPYLSTDLDANFYAGSGGDNHHVYPDANLNSTNRFGINIGIGTLIDVPILPIGIDIEMKYSFSNLVGKKFNSIGYPWNGYGGLPQTSTYYLNDATNPNDSNDHNREINFLVIKIGVLFRII